jgi:hypothetical protein
VGAVCVRTHGVCCELVAEGEGPWA